MVAPLPTAPSRRCTDRRTLATLRSTSVQSTRRVAEEAGVEVRGRSTASPAPTLLHSSCSPTRHRTTSSTSLLLEEEPLTTRVWEELVAVAAEVRAEARRGRGGEGGRGPGGWRDTRTGPIELWGGGVMVRQDEQGCD